jgi:RNA-directed DNA polymerase
MDGGELLANRDIERSLRHRRNHGRDKECREHVANHADDFVSPADAFRDIGPLRGLILGRRYAEKAPTWTRQVKTRPGPTANETKTAARNARREHFGFLG